MRRAISTDYAICTVQNISQNIYYLTHTALVNSDKTTFILGFTSVAQKFMFPRLRNLTMEFIFIANRYINEKSKENNTYQELK